MEQSLLLKKSFLLGICLTVISCFSLHAQLKVKSTGRTQVGNDHPYSYGRLQLGNDGATDGLSFYEHAKGGASARIFRDNDIFYFIRSASKAKGLRINNQGQIAMGDLTKCNYDATAFRHTFSIFGEHLAIATYVYHEYDMGDAQKSVVYRDRTAAYAVWNGPNTKTCYIQGNGEIYSKGLLITSDISTKKNIETIRNPLQKVLQLRGVTFESIYDKKELIKTADKEVLLQSGTEKEQNEFTPAVAAQMNKELERKRIGVVAQEVEAIVPEAVRTTHDGKKAVSYPELVGLLIEAIKEQQVQIEELREYAGLNPEEAFQNLRSSESQNATTGIHAPDLSGCKLYQNTPNPFSGNTEIRYELSGKIQEALICIFDMQGKMLKKLNAPIGNNSITINANLLEPGMYFYSLIVDGQEIDTKKMILTQ